MDKKGMDERQILWIAYYVVMVVITISAITFVTSAVSNARLTEKFYAKDLAYTLDLAYAGNGDLEFKYAIEDREYDFFIGEQNGEHKVIVGKQLNEQGYGGDARSYRYNSKQDFGLFKKPSELVITKEQGRVSINGVIAGSSLNVNEYLSEVIGTDDYGSYRWIVSEIKEDSLVVKKSYLPGVTGKIAGEIERALKPYQEDISKASTKHNVEENLVKAIIYKESTGNKNAENTGSGAVGLMQVLPSTAGLTREELLIPGTNIDAGTRYIAEQIENFGDVELALAAYNWGPGNTRKNCGEHFSLCSNVPTETINYVEKVVGYKAALDIMDTGHTDSGKSYEVKVGEQRELDDKHTVTVVKNNLQGQVRVIVA